MQASLVGNKTIINKIASVLNLKTDGYRLNIKDEDNITREQLEKAIEIGVEHGLKKLKHGMLSWSMPTGEDDED